MREGGMEPNLARTLHVGLRDATDARLRRLHRLSRLRRNNRAHCARAKLGNANWGGAAEGKTERMDNNNTRA